MNNSNNEINNNQNNNVSVNSLFELYNNINNNSNVNSINTTNSDFNNTMSNDTNIGYNNSLNHANININQNNSFINAQNELFFNNSNQIFTQNVNNYDINNKIKSMFNNNDNVNANTNTNNDIDFLNSSTVSNIHTQVIEPKPVVVDNIIQSNGLNNVDNILVNNNVNNKNKYKDEYVYDDGLDTNDDDKKFKIINILTNKVFLVIVLILLFVCVSIVVIKAFYFGKKIDTYEEYFTVIENKLEDEVKIYKDEEIDDEILKKEAASELISCISSSVDMNKIPDSINSIVKEINNYYNQSNNHFAFVYKDLFTGFTVSYNEDQSIFAASSIKAPTDIYIWEMASSGKVNLDEILTYTSGYYNSGSGVLKNKKVNTKYSVRTLLEYSTVTSDNAAHNMLMDKYGRENMLSFWKEKGTKTIFRSNTNWGSTSGYDAMIYMEELYKFYVNNSEYGDDVMKNFINSYPKFLKGKNDYKVASKSGWSGSALHDVSIIFADNPYIVVALSNLGDTGYYTSYFNTANDLAYRLHTEYWKYKMDMCNDIRQY